MNFAKIGIDLIGIALLMMPIITIAFCPLLLMWLTMLEREKMARGVAELIEKRMRG